MAVRRYAKNLRTLAMFAVMSALLSSCAEATLAWTPLRPKGADAAPPLDAATLAEWRAKAPEIRTLFQKHVYGVFPDRSTISIEDRRLLDEAALEGAATLEEIALVATMQYGGAPATRARFKIVALVPNAPGPHPTIVLETFCPNDDTMPFPGVSAIPGAQACADGAGVTRLVQFVFGRYIATPPLENIVARGYAVATLFPGEYAPDEATAGDAALDRLAGASADAKERLGAVGAWAWGFSRAVDYLEGDERYDMDRIAVYGHSRYGKSALVAAAFDARIDAVIAHQSGTGGASLSRDKPGESVAQITEQYPHWFARAFAGYAGRENTLPLDQHHLLALIAPRPILLGNARRDVWSDPEGAFRAAKAASAAYRLYGDAGLATDRLDEFRPGDDIAYWLRAGTHGVVEEDWPAFLEFLDAQFATTRDASTTDRREAL